MSEDQGSTSPRWGWPTKLVIGFTIVAILAWFFVQFRGVIGPLLMAFILAYLVFPLANGLHKLARLPWRLAVTLIYFILLLVVVGLLTLGGLAITEQIQALIFFLQKSVNDLPAFLNTVSTQAYVIGPFHFDLTTLNLSDFTNQIVSAVQYLLGQAGTLAGLVATSAANLFIWSAFIFVLSYFVLSETGGPLRPMIDIHIANYEADFARLKYELSHIWNAFLRGQLIIISLAVAIYFLVLLVLGVHYYPVLALLAGFARFIPYVGPLIAWSSYGLVSYFQGTTIFGLSSLAYAVVIVGTALVIDSLLDNLISPRIMAQSLRVHPAAVLIGTIIGANLIGVIGVVLAAPVVASLKLVGKYVLRKLLDEDPWKGAEEHYVPPKRFVLFHKVRDFWQIVKARWKLLQKEKGSE
ncbi:MAG: AI-2E family transporter [Chloroflexi bacterium]|nr:AI-2E family transporter [Chloroflexota bacterium]